MVGTWSHIWSKYSLTLGENPQEILWKSNEVEEEENVEKNHNFNKQKVICVYVCMVGQAGVGALLQILMLT